MLNIFIADDESLVRDSIRSCIDENTTEFAICGEAADGETGAASHQGTKTRHSDFGRENAFYGWS